MDDLRLHGLVGSPSKLTANATPDKVLAGNTFYSTDPKVKETGTMIDNGAIMNTITVQGGSYTVPQGYHNGSGKVTANIDVDSYLPNEFVFSGSSHTVPGVGMGTYKVIASDKDSIFLFVSSNPSKIYKYNNVTFTQTGSINFASYTYGINSACEDKEYIYINYTYGTDASKAWLSKIRKATLQVVGNISSTISRVSYIDDIRIYLWNASFWRIDIFDKDTLQYIGYANVGIGGVTFIRVDNTHIYTIIGDNSGKIRRFDKVTLHFLDEHTPWSYTPNAVVMDNNNLYITSDQQTSIVVFNKLNLTSQTKPIYDNMTPHVLKADEKYLYVLKKDSSKIIRYLHTDMITANRLEVDFFTTLYKDYIAVNSSYIYMSTNSGVGKVITMAYTNY